MTSPAAGQIDPSFVMTDSDPKITTALLVENTFGIDLDVVSSFPSRDTSLTFIIDFSYGQQDASECSRAYCERARRTLHS